MTLVLSGRRNTVIPMSNEEDDDLLARSSKKIKNGNGDNSRSVLQGHWPKPGENFKDSTSGKQSFANKLKGVNRGDEDSADEEEYYDNDSVDGNSSDSLKEQNIDADEPLYKTSEDPNRNFPTFTFSNRMKKKLYRAWRKSLIVKLLDRYIGYKALETRLQSMWVKRGVIRLINIGHGYYVVKFTNKEDYYEALTGGPWMIYDHYLTMQPWEPNFRSDRATIDKVAVWVRLPKIFMEYYDKEALTIIGNRIGKTIRIDMNTSCQLRGHYARICVLVELGKQLMSGFYLDGEAYYLKYEGLHMLCTSCGVYGHRSETCSSKKINIEENVDAANGKTTVNSDQRMEDSHKIHDHWTVVQKQR
ncbi:uncharacterized protein LOC114755557 [Neltuma alba]|uniref:uncharacterized protein LOC114755557 n=1 Tax=Neltuma alba TaxID=207710 RepID=UPI0010A470E6|nr:uncharacterized protein LOC114755557 [Prosopis alba]